MADRIRARLTIHVLAGEGRGWGGGLVRPAFRVESRHDCVLVLFDAPVKVNHNKSILSDKLHLTTTKTVHTENKYDENFVCKIVDFEDSIPIKCSNGYTNQF